MLTVQNDRKFSAFPFCLINCAKVSLGGAWQWYQNSLRTSPVATKAITSCVIGVIGDIVATHLKNRKQAMMTLNERRRNDLLSLRAAINPRRLAIFGAFGLVVTGA